jgi:hypothetical protein
METHLVKLIEIPEDDGIVWKGWKELLAHLPPSPLVVFPCHILLVAPVGGLRVIATEERVATEDDVFRVDPILRVSIGFVAEHIL